MLRTKVHEARIRFAVDRPNGLSRGRRNGLRKRLAVLAMSLGAAAVLLPASPAAATTCYIEDPGVDDVQCMLHGTPSWELCHKLRIC